MSGSHDSFVCGMLELVINNDKGKIGPCEKNLLWGQKQPLVGRDSIIFPPLQTKLGLIKHLATLLCLFWFVLVFFCSTFPDLSNEKTKSGIFDGPQFRKMFEDQAFV